MLLNSSISRGTRAPPHHKAVAGNKAQILAPELALDALDQQLNLLLRIGPYTGEQRRRVRGDRHLHVQLLKPTKLLEPGVSGPGADGDLNLSVFRKD